MNIDSFKFNYIKFNNRNTDGKPLTYEQTINNVLFSASMHFVGDDLINNSDEPNKCFEITKKLILDDTLQIKDITEPQTVFLKKDELFMCVFDKDKIEYDYHGSVLKNIADKTLSNKIVMPFMAGKLRELKGNEYFYIYRATDDKGATVTFTEKK